MGAMNGVMDDLKQSLESVKTTGVDFEQIAGSVQHVSNRTESLTGDISALTHATEEVSDAMGTILALTEENAAGIETSAASIQETNATIEAVTTAAAHLAQIATELHALTVDFKVDEPIDGDELLSPDETPEPLVQDLSYDEVAAASLDERAETEQTLTDNESADPTDSDSSDDAHR